jgi:hypothetical protein
MQKSRWAPKSEEAAGAQTATTEKSPAPPPPEPQPSTEPAAQAPQPAPVQEPYTAPVCSACLVLFIGFIS